MKGKIKAFQGVALPVLKWDVVEISIVEEPAGVCDAGDAGDAIRYSK